MFRVDSKIIIINQGTGESLHGQLKTVKLEGGSFLFKVLVGGNEIGPEMIDSAALEAFRG